MARQVFLFLVLVTFATVCAYAQGSGEQLTITTYYPSPYGSYNELQTNRFSVGDANRDGQINSADLPTVNGTIAFEPRTGGNPAGWGDGKKGEFAYSNNQNKFYYHDGSGWKPVGGSNVKVATGTLLTGQQIPVPAGFSASDCKWIISTNRDPGRNDEDIYELRVFADDSRVIHIDECNDGLNGICNSWNSVPETGGSANYMIICGAN